MFNHSSTVWKSNLSLQYKLSIWWHWGDWAVGFRFGAPRSNPERPNSNFIWRLKKAHGWSCYNRLIGHLSHSIGKIVFPSYQDSTFHGDRIGAEPETFDTEDCESSHEAELKHPEHLFVRFQFARRNWKWLTDFFRLCSTFPLKIPPPRALPSRVFTSPIKQKTDGFDEQTFSWNLLTNKSLIFSSIRKKQFFHDSIFLSDPINPSFWIISFTLGH